jgi:hypothetical protein
LVVGWSKDHAVTIGSFNSTLWFSRYNLVKLETERAPQVESKNHRLERSESGM